MDCIGQLVVCSVIFHANVLITANENNPVLQKLISNQMLKQYDKTLKLSISFPEMTVNISKDQLL